MIESSEVTPSGVPEAAGHNIYSAPAALPPAPRRPNWLRGLLLATLPSLIFFLLAPWLSRLALPAILGLIGWCGVLILTFYGVGAFVWSSAARPTWGQAVLVAFVTGGCLRLTSLLAEGIAALFW